MSGNSHNTTRRKRERKRAEESRIFRISVEDSPGRQRWITADLVDHSDGGFGVALATPLKVGAPVIARGRISGSDEKDTVVRAHVAWCLERADGSFRAGLTFEDSTQESDPFHEWHVEQSAEDHSDADHYEVLQLSAAADPDTIHRVFRMLAQRYHPDNQETGDEDRFKQVLAAYRVLNDPERRAAYDAVRLNRRQARWKIFQQDTVPASVDAERRKRRGILELLYTQRINEPEKPSVTIHELEDLLGCPRDHLQVSLWYLKAKHWVVRSDNGKYTITVDGVDEAERDWEGLTSYDERKLLPRPAASGGS